MTLHAFKNKFLACSVFSFNLGAFHYQTLSMSDSVYRVKALFNMTIHLLMFLWADDQDSSPTDLQLAELPVWNVTEASCLRNSLASNIE